MEVRKKINLKHLTVWILVLLILVSALSLRLEITESINRALIFLIAQVIVFYTCSLILIPLLLIPKKRLFFVLGVFITIVSSICIIHFGGIILDYRNPLLNDLVDIHASRRYILALALSSFAKHFLKLNIQLQLLEIKESNWKQRPKLQDMKLNQNSFVHKLILILYLIIKQHLHTRSAKIRLNLMQFYAYQTY